jgi:hypothetical protein
MSETLNRQLAVGDRVLHKQFPPISRHKLALYCGASGITIRSTSIWISPRPPDIPMSSRTACS